jgi:hypothetical protein
LHSLGLAVRDICADVCRVSDTLPWGADRPLAPRLRQSAGRISARLAQVLSGEPDLATMTVATRLLRILAGQ